MPSTAYCLACIYAYIGKKVTTVGELQDTLADVKAMMLREPRTNSIFQSGVGTAIAAEMIEACKYVKTDAPYEGTAYHGHFVDAEVRELGVPLVTGDIPGFVVIIGPAPSTEEAIETIKGYQSRGIFVFLIGGIIEQAVEAGLSMGFPVRVVPVGEEIWSVGHVISLVVRAAMIFGNVQPGDCDGFHKYTFDRINAFVNAYKPVPTGCRGCLSPSPGHVISRSRHLTVACYKRTAPSSSASRSSPTTTTICGQFRSPSSSMMIPRTGSTPPSKRAASS